MSNNETTVHATIPSLSFAKVQLTFINVCCDAFASHTRFPVTRTCDGAHTYLPGPVALLYRLVREILSNALYRATRSHIRAWQWYCVPSFNTICLSFRLDSTWTLCLLVFLFYSFLPRSSRSKERRRWRLITTQSPLPVRPTPTRSQKAATAFCRRGAFTTAVPV